MAPGDVQEPTEELWIRVKSDWLSRHAGWLDAIWPLDSESDARRLGDAWDRLRDALTALHDQAGPHVESLHDTWTDFAGVSAYAALHRFLDGSSGGGDGLLQLAGHCHELAEACRKYAKDLADIKGEVVADILINVALFALSTFIAGPAGEAFFVTRLSAQIAAKVAQAVEKIAASGRMARLAVGALKFGGETVLNAGRGAVGGGVGNLLGQEFSSWRGYGDVDPDKVKAAVKAGGIGGALGHVANRTVGKAVTDTAAKGLGKLPKISEDAAKQLGSVAGATVSGAVTGAGTNYFLHRPMDEGAIAGAARGGMHALGANGMKNFSERVTGNEHPTFRDLVRSHLPAPPDGGPPNTPMPPPGDGSPAPHHGQSGGEAHSSAEQPGTVQHTEAHSSAEQSGTAQHSSAEQQAAAQRAEVPLAERATGTTGIHSGAELAPRIDAGSSGAEVRNFVRSPSAAPAQLPPSTRTATITPHSPANATPPARSGDAPASAPVKGSGPGADPKGAPSGKDSAPAPEKSAPARAEDGASRAAENGQGRSSAETTAAAEESKAGEVIDLNSRRNPDAAGAKAVEAAGAKKASEAENPPDEPPGPVQRPDGPQGPVRGSDESGSARLPTEPGTGVRSAKAAAATHGESTPPRTTRSADTGALPAKAATATHNESAPPRTTRSPDTDTRPAKAATATHNESAPPRTTRAADTDTRPEKATATRHESTPTRSETAGRDEAGPAKSPTELKDFRPKETFAGRARRVLLSEPETKLAELSERAAYARDRGIGWLGDQLLGSLGSHPAGPRPGDRWFDVETRRNEAELADVLGRLRGLGYSLRDLADQGVASRHLALADRMVHRELGDAELKQALVARTNLSSAEGHPARSEFDEVLSRTGDLLAEAKGLEAKAHETIAKAETAETAETPEPQPVALTVLHGEGVSDGEPGTRALLRSVPVLTGASEALAVENRSAGTRAPKAVEALLPDGEAAISPDRVRALPDLWNNYHAQARFGGLSAHLTLLHDAETGNLDAAGRQDFRLALRDWLAEVPTPEGSGLRTQFRTAFDQLSATVGPPSTGPHSPSAGPEPVRAEPMLPRARLGQSVSFAERMLGPVFGPAPAPVTDPVRPPIGFPARPPVRTEPFPGVGDPRPGSPVPLAPGDPVPVPGDPFRAGETTAAPVPRLPPDFPDRSDRPGSLPDVRYPQSDVPEVAPVVPAAFPYPAEKTAARPVRERTEVVPLRHDCPGEAKPLPPVPDEDADERFELPREVREQLTEQELADLWALVRATGARPGDILRWIVDKVLYDRVREAGRGLPHQDASLADKLRFLATERESDRLLVGDRLAELTGRPRARAQIAEEEKTAGDGAAGIYLRYGALTTLSFAYAEFAERRDLLDRIEAQLEFAKSAAADSPKLAERAYELALKLAQKYLDLVGPELGFLHALSLSGDEERAALGFGGATEFRPRGQVHEHGETIGLAEFSFSRNDGARRNVVVARLRSSGSAVRERLVKNARRYLRSQRPGEPKPYVVLSRGWRGADEADLAELTDSLRKMGFAAVLYSDPALPAEEPRTTALYLDDAVRAESAAAPARSEKPWLGNVFPELWKASGAVGQPGLRQIAQLPAKDVVAVLSLLLRPESAPAARDTHFAALGRELARLPEDQRQALRTKLHWLGEWIDGRPPWKQAFDDAQGLRTASGLLAAVNAGVSVEDIRQWAPDFGPLHASPDEEVAAAAVLTELALHETGFGDLWQPGVFDAPVRPEGDAAFPEFPVRDATSTGPDYHVVVVRAASLDEREAVFARLRRNLAANGAHPQFVVLTGEMTTADPESLGALSRQLLAEGFDAVAVHRPGSPFEVLAARTNLLTSLTAHAVGPLRPTIAPGLAEWLSGKAAAKHQEHLDLAGQAQRATEEPETEPRSPVVPQPPPNAVQPSAEEAATPPLTGAIEIHAPLSTIPAARQRPTAEDIVRRMLPAAAVAAGVHVMENGPFPRPSDDTVFLDQSGTVFAFQVIPTPNLGYSRRNPITFQVFREPPAGQPLPLVVLRLPDWLAPDLAVLPMAHAMAAGAALLAAHRRGEQVSPPEQQFWHDRFPGTAPVPTPADLGYFAQVAALGAELDREGTRRRDRRRMREHLSRLLSCLGVAGDDPHASVRLSALAAHSTRVRAEGIDRALAVASRFRPAKAVEGYRVTHWPVQDPAVEIGHRLPVAAPARRFDRAPAVEAAIRAQVGKAAERTGVLLVPTGPGLRYDVFHDGRHLFTAAFHVLPRTTLESTGVSVHPGARLLSGYLPARLRPRDVEEIVRAALAFGTRYFRTATCDPGTLRPDTDADRLPESPADRALEARLEVLGDQITTTPGWRPRRRQQLISQLRSLLEHAGLEKQLPDYSYRVAALGAHARAVVDTFAVERKNAAYPTTAFTIATTVVFEQPATAAMTVALSISGFASGHPGNGIGYFVYGVASAVLGAAMTRRYDIASDKQAALKKRYDEIRANVDRGREQHELVNSWHEANFGTPLRSTGVPAPAQLESDAPDIALPLRTRIFRFSTPPLVALGAAAAVGYPLDIEVGSFFALVATGTGTAVFRPLAEGYSRRRRKGAELAAHDAIRRELHEYDLEDAKELYRQLLHARAAIEGLMAGGAIPDAALAELTPAPAERAAVDFAEHVTGSKLMDAVASFLPYLPDLYKITHPRVQPLKALLDHFTPLQILAAVDLAKLGVAGWISALADNHLAAGEVANKLTRIAMRMRAERETQLPVKIRDRDLLLRDLVGEALVAVGTAQAGSDPARASEVERALAEIRSKPPLLPKPVSRKAAVSRTRYAAVITAKSVAAGGFTAGLSVLAGVSATSVWGAVAAGVAGLLAVVGKPYYRIREILTDDRAGTPVERQSDRDALANGHVLRLLFETAGREQQGEQPMLPAVTPLSEFEPLAFADESVRSGEWAGELRETLDALDRAVENELGHWGFRPTLERRQALLRDELPRLSARAKAQLAKYEGSEHGFLAHHLDATLREYLRTGEGDLAAHVTQVLRQHENADADLIRGLISVVRQHEATGNLAARLGDLVREHGPDRSRQLVDRVTDLLNSRPREEKIAAHVELLVHWHGDSGDGQLARKVRDLLRQPPERLPGELRRLLLPFEHERTRAARLAVAAIRELNELLDEYQAASDPMRFARLEPPATQLPEPDYRSPGQVLADDLANRPVPARTVLGLRFLAAVVPEDWAKQARAWSAEQLAEARQTLELAIWSGKKNGKYTLPAVTADTAPAAVLEALLREEVPLLREINPRYRSARLDRYRYRSNCVSATSALFHRMAGWDTTAVPAGPEPETLAALWQRLGGTWEAHGSEYDSLIAALTGRKGLVAAVAVRSLGDDGTIARHVSAVVVSERTGVPVFADPMTGSATKLPARPLEIHLLPVDLAALRSTEPVALPPAGLERVRPAERTEGYHGKRLRAAYDVLRQSPQFAARNLPPLPAEQQSPPVHVLTHPVFHLWRRSPLARATRTHSLPAIDAGTVSKSQAVRFVREAQPGYDRPDPNAYGAAWDREGRVDQSYLAYWFGGFWFHSHDSYDSVIIAMAERPLGARALLHIVTTDHHDNEYHQLGWVAHDRYGVAFFDRLQGKLLRLPEYPARLALLPFTDAFLPWPYAPPEYQPAAGRLYVPDAPVPSPGVDLRRPYREPRAARVPAPGPMWTPGHRDLARDPLSSGADEGRGVKFSTPGPRRPLRPPMRQAPHPAGPPPDAPKPARYGPYHRLESRSQSPETAKLIEESSEVWGRTPRHGSNPAVQAWNGPLPPDRRGVEFYTDVKPHFYGAKQGLREWRGEQGIRADDEFAKLDVVVTKNTQVEAAPEPAENVLLAEAVAEVEARGPEAILREDALAPPPRPLEPTPAQARTLDAIRESAGDPPPAGPPGDVAELVRWLAGETGGAAGPGSVRFDRVSWIYQALEVLRRDGPARITGVEDGLAAPEASGRREIRVSLRLPGGRPGELRLGLTAIDEVTGTARALGNFARAVEEAQPSTPRDEAVAAVLRRRQRELFEQALRRGLPAPPPAEPESFADPDEAALAAAEIVSHVEFGDNLASANETHWLTYADGAQAIYKPAAGESRSLAVPIPHGGQGFRENAMYRLARAAGSDVVPVTAHIDGPRGPGSAQRRIEGLSPALDVSAYPRAQQQEMAYLGYVGASSDCKALSKDGNVVAIDNGQNFPDYADDLIGINSPFVAAWLDRPLDAGVLARIRAIDPGWLVRMLRASGMSEYAADEARDRHEEVQRLGRIGGQQWSGRIWNGREGLARDYR